MRRSPVQTLLVAAAVASGVIIGTRIIAERMSARADARTRAARPDITLVGVAPQELPAHGYRLGESSPRSWSEISIRLYEDDRGTVNLMRCRIDPGEAGALLAFPPDSRRPVDDRPPADWPWGGPGDPFRVPEWWRPSGTQGRLHEALPATGATRGLYANYDPVGRWLHLWSWTRTDVHPQRPDLLAHLVADELVSTLADHLVQRRYAASADGWIIAERFAARDLRVASRLPTGVEHVSAALLPLRDRHRYLLRVDGLDEAAARQLVAEVPLRELAADGAPPASWEFALPAGGVPAWFMPGPGPRWGYCLLAIGPGSVERGRWVAYDRVAHALLVWDWEDQPARPAEADITAAAPSQPAAGQPAP